VAWALVILPGLAVTGIAWRMNRQLPHQFVDLPIDLGADALIGPLTSVAITGDSSRLAYLVRTPDGRRQLATRALNDHVPAVLQGTDGADSPFFSPDGRWIGFFADGKLKKVSVAAVQLYRCGVPPRGVGEKTDDCSTRLHPGRRSVTRPGVGRAMEFSQS
jgi:serine/threonine-protein kinase